MARHRLGWLVKTADRASAAYDCVIQSDGRIVLGGYATSDYALVRYNTDGSLDTTFDSDGKVITPVGISSGVSEEVLLQPDGKLVAVGYSFGGVNTDFSLVRYNSDGTLDTSFNGDGKTIVSLGATADSAFAAALQADGKIVAAGYASNGGLDNDFALARIHTKGSIGPVRNLVSASRGW